jgi:amino acid adenylation domain-containing protein
MRDALPFEKAEVERSIGDRFDRIVRRFPDSRAVSESGRVTTYADLDAAARRYAGGLSARLARVPGPIALMLDPGAPLLAAMLGSLKAGRFYVPLDPVLPAARLAAVLRELDAAALIAGEPWLDSARCLAGGGTPVWAAEDLASGPAVAGPPARVSPDDFAYVLFTSGSTGRPKGVIQSHRNVLHNVRKLTTGLTIGPDDRLTLLSSVSFGASVSDIFGALLNGASVCPYSLSGDGLRRLPEFLTREAITIYHSVPSVFRSFSSTLDGREDLSRLRIVRLGGEPVFASDFDLYRNRFPRSCGFHVGLGSTEMNVIRLWSAGHDTPWPGGTPLGYAVDETEVVLLDEAGRETDGAGEIGVRARTLAVGYWRDPAATAAAFVPVPGRPGVRLYRTGDLGRMLPDGCLLHLGRKDARLKVRGHRVEIAEVEAALLAVPGVSEAAAGGRERPEGTRLVAWLVRDSRHPPGIGDLRRALTGRLPASMVPSSFVFLDALPRTASGKVDRQALPEPVATRPPLATPFLEPRDPTEAAVAAAFREVLEVDRVGAEDDFFELGGDSLSAVEALTAVSERLGVELSAADLLEAPTPAGLAARARAGGASEPPDLVRLQDGEKRPVFVVPGGAGDGEDLFAARRVARSTGGGFPFLCFRSGPAPHPPVPELAARFVRQLRTACPHGPYALVGDCVGGIVAFAMAQQLREEGDRVALLALLDPPYPTRMYRRRAWLLSHAPWTGRLAARLGYFRRRLYYHGGVLRALPRGRLAYAVRIVRVGARGFVPSESVRRRQARERRASYVGTLLAWRPVPFAGRTLLVASEEGARRGFSAAWSRLAETEIIRIPGDHASFIAEHGKLVAAALRRALEAAG